MKLQVGKQYVTRGGEEAIVTSRDNHPKWPFNLRTSDGREYCASPEGIVWSNDYIDDKDILRPVLAVGETYTTRDGKKCVKINNKSSLSEWPFQSENMDTYSPDGKFWYHLRDMPEDLVDYAPVEEHKYKLLFNPFIGSWVDEMIAMDSIINTTTPKEVTMTTTEQEIQKTKDALAKLEAAYAAEQEAKKPKVFAPYSNQTYLTINGDGSVETYINRSQLRTDDFVKVGNVYEIRVQAELIVKNRKIHRKLQEIAAYKPSFDYDTENFFLQYDHDEDDFYVDSESVYQGANTVYFATEDAALDAVGDINSVFGSGSLKAYLTVGII